MDHDRRRADYPAPREGRGSLIGRFVIWRGSDACREPLRRLAERTVASFGTGLRCDRMHAKRPEDPALSGQRPPVPARAVFAQVELANPVGSVRSADRGSASITRLIHQPPPAGSPPGPGLPPRHVDCSPRQICSSGPGPGRTTGTISQFALLSYRGDRPPARYRPTLTRGPLSKTAGTTSKRTLPARLNAYIPHPDGRDHLSINAVYGRPAAARTDRGVPDRPDLHASAGGHRVSRGRPRRISLEGGAEVPSLNYRT
jgi:hypothetical protein